MRAASCSSRTPKLVVVLVRVDHGGRCRRRDGLGAVHRGARRWRCSSRASPSGRWRRRSSRWPATAIHARWARRSGCCCRSRRLAGCSCRGSPGRATIAYGYRAGLVVPALAAFGVAAGTVLAWQARARRARRGRRGAGEMTPLVLFDLDGTLVDTTDLILQSFAHAFDAHLPGRLPSRRDLVATFGRSLPAALQELAAENGAADPRALADEMLVTYRDFQRQHHDTLIRPFDGIDAALSALARQRPSPRRRHQQDAALRATRHAPVRSGAPLRRRRVPRRCDPAQAGSGTAAGSGATGGRRPGRVRSTSATARTTSSPAAPRG